MYAGDSLAEVLAFIQGIDHGQCDGPLVGFREWLVVRQGGGNNLHYVGLVRAELRVPLRGRSVVDDAGAIKGLGELLALFFGERATLGLAGIFHAYLRWLTRQSWYDGPLRSPRARRRKPPRQADPAAPPKVRGKGRRRPR